MDGLRTHRGGSTGELAQLLTSPTRNVSRKTKSLNLKQLGGVPPQVATGDPWSKEQTDLLHWQKLQPPRTFYRLQGKSEHEVPPTEKSGTTSTCSKDSFLARRKKSGQKPLDLFCIGLSVLFAVGSEIFFFPHYPRDKIKATLSVTQALLTAHRKAILLSAPTNRMGSMRISLRAHSKMRYKTLSSVIYIAHT